MKDIYNTPVIPIKEKLQHNRLNSFFLLHLNIIYCAKSYLVKHLPEIQHLADFADLKFAIAETTDEVKKQLIRMRKIFDLLEVDLTMEQPKGLIGLVDETFVAVKKNSGDRWLRDMSILYYMQNIESVETVSFQLLHLAAAKLGNKEVTQLLRESYDEAKGDRLLMLLIMARYIENK